MAASSKDVDYIDRQFQAISRVGYAINETLTLADQSDDHNNEWSNEAFPLMLASTLLTRHHEDEISICWLRDCQASRPYPMLYVAARNIQDTDNE